MGGNFLSGMLKGFAGSELNKQATAAQNQIMARQKEADFYLKVLDSGLQNKDFTTQDVGLLFTKAQEALTGNAGGKANGAKKGRGGNNANILAPAAMIAHTATKKMSGPPSPNGPQPQTEKLGTPGAITPQYKGTGGPPSPPAVGGTPGGPPAPDDLSGALRRAYPSPEQIEQRNVTQARDVAQAQADVKEGAAEKEQKISYDNLLKSGWSEKDAAGIIYGNVKPSSTFKVEGRNIIGSSITDQSTDAFGKPIDPKQNYDRVQTPEGMQYMPGQSTKKPAPSLLGLIQAANGGDQKAAQAVQTYEAIQTRIRQGFAEGRAKYQLVNVMSPDGAMKTLPLNEAANRINSGEPLTMVSTAPFSAATNVQIVASESYPALDGVEDSAGAFDNLKDRAIFAKLFTGNPETTVGNLMNQGLRKGLSDEGKQLAVRLGRLLETMGRVRQQMGLPQTDQAQGLSMNLVPAGQTPSADYARQQIEQIRGMIDNALAIPAYRGIGGGTGNRGAQGPPSPPQASGGTPPPGATHTGRGSVDKKLHYLDSKGNDLGPVPAQ